MKSFHILQGQFLGTQLLIYTFNLSRELEVFTSAKDREDSVLMSYFMLRLHLD